MLLENASSDGMLSSTDAGFSLFPSDADSSGETCSEPMVEFAPNALRSS